MPIDASIYQNLRSVELPSIMESAGKAMNLSALGMQQERMSNQMAAEDKEAKYQAHLRKASVIGNALEGMAGMTEQERAATYPKVRSELIGSGVLTPQDAPEQYDPGFYKQALFRSRESKEGIERMLHKSQIAKNQAEAAKDRAAAAGAGKKDPNKELELTSGLRREWTGLPTTKATQDVAQSIERVRNAYANPSPAGDLTMIYSFMKMNDPGSTVREGEFATAQNAAGVPTQIANAYNKALKGERLSDEQRHDFASQAEKMYGGQLNAQKSFDSQYSALAQRYGVDPSLVMMKFPEPRELKLAIKKEEEKPGWFASLFGKPAVAATPAVSTRKVDYSKMSDDELFSQWSARKGQH